MGPSDTNRAKANAKRDGNKNTIIISTCLRSTNFHLSLSFFTHCSVFYSFFDSSAKKIICRNTNSWEYAYNNCNLWWLFAFIITIIIVGLDHIRNMLLSDQIHSLLSRNSFLRALISINRIVFLRISIMISMNSLLKNKLQWINNFNYSWTTRNFILTKNSNSTKKFEFQKPQPPPIISKISRIVIDLLWPQEIEIFRFEIRIKNLSFDSTSVAWAMRINLNCFYSSNDIESIKFRERTKDERHRNSSQYWRESIVCKF